MLNKFKFVIVIFICGSFIWGCASTIKQISESLSEPAIEINIPDRFFIKNEKIPVDVKTVCTALLNKLRHRGETEFVRFDPVDGQEIQEELFDYEGFNVILIDITGFEAEVVEKNKVQAILEGVFHFEDAVGRRASTYFAVKYSKTPDGITISKAGVTNIAPLFPRVEAYYIPVEAFKKSQKITEYGELYAFALENSLDMKPTKEEIQAYQAYQNLSAWKKITEAGKTEKKKLAVVIFCLDRLSDVARLEVTVSEGGKQIPVEPRYIDENGWPIAVVTGEFIPDSWGTTFDINAYYTPEEKDKKILIGKFSNQKDYNPKQKQAQVRNDLKQKDPSIEDRKENSAVSGKVQSADSKKEGSTASGQVPSDKDIKEGPIATGSVFLNPSKKTDAELIQKRLSDLGYYQAKIDGQFGKGSQRAVQKFKKDSGLGDNTTWDIQTQKMLFKGSDL
jgi:hypothetical protein